MNCTKKQMIGTLPPLACSNQCTDIKPIKLVPSHLAHIKVTACKARRYKLPPHFSQTKIRIYDQYLA